MTSPISRRMMLRAAGAAIALPWLESLPVLAAASEPPRALPKRFAVLFMGNGISGNHWWARGRGAAMTLSRSLGPLEPLKQKINVFDGLFNQPAVGRGIHPAQTGSLLSGVAVADGPVARAGISVDQAIANHVGRETAIPSLVMACEPPAAGCHETGFSMVYSSHISWRRADAPVPGEGDPSRAFDRLFGRRAGGRRQSILDGVADSVNRLARRVSASDSARLDRYLTSVREVEARVDRFRSGDAADLRDRMRLICDIVALAFQADMTRVASLTLANDLSSLAYPFLDVPGDHHSASHDDLSDGYERIVRFHVSQFAYLGAALESMPERDGTVLDNCCLLWLSNMWAGWKHDNMKLPVVAAGGLGGTLATGRALEYLHAGDEGRRVCSLYLSVMNRMGVPIDRFGDADRPLDRL